MRSNHSRGFTLVEILIVVVILGILASIVIPQFTNASTTANASNVDTQLQTIRGALELYQVQHGGTYPNLVATGWTPLITKTDTNGSSGTKFGPYLMTTPANPFTSKSAIVAGTSAAGGSSTTDGWVWDNANKKLFAVGYNETTHLYTAH